MQMSDSGIEEIDRSASTEREQSSAISIALERNQDPSYRGVITNAIFQIDDTSSIGGTKTSKVMRFDCGFNPTLIRNPAALSLIVA
jgi:hypothetical protein